MKWWTRLSRIAKKSPIGDFLQRRVDIVSETDPNRISVEKVRSFFGVSTRVAKTLCDMAVKEGVFKRVVEVRCPNRNCHNVLGRFPSLEEVPAEMDCDICDLDEDQSRFTKDELYMETIYQFVNEGAVA